MGREPNLWVLRADGSEEIFVDIGLDPTWSPDGGRLAYAHTTIAGEIGLRLATTVSWTYEQVDDLPFPDTAHFIVGWSQP